MKKILLTLIFLIATLSVYADFADSFGGSDDTGTKVDFTGSLRYEARVFSGLGERINNIPQAYLNIDVKKKYSELHAKIKVYDVVENSNEKMDAKVDLDELFIRLFYDNFTIEAGKMKVVWGKGDQLHVVDLLNADDLSDTVIPDYLERRIAENMLKVNWFPFGSASNAKAEFVYAPTFTFNKFDQNGVWKPYAVYKLENFVNEGFSYNILKHNKFDDGQFAIRFSNSVNGWDYAFSIYHGRDRMPAYELDLLNKKITIDNNRITVFGLELGKIIATVNTRWEFAYYLGKDSDGDDPTIKNDRVMWIVGGDRATGIHNLNLNVQWLGNYVLNEDKIKENKILLAPNFYQNIDTDYDSDGDYFTNMIVVKADDSFKNDTIKPAIKFIYNIEKKDYMMENKLEWIARDDTSISFGYTMFYGDSDTLFGEFYKNDFIFLKVKYDF